MRGALELLPAQQCSTLLCGSRLGVVRCDDVELGAQLFTLHITLHPCMKASQPIRSQAAIFIPRPGAPESGGSGGYQAPRFEVSQVSRWVLPHGELRVYSQSCRPTFGDNLDGSRSMLHVDNVRNTPTSSERSTMISRHLKHRCGPHASSHSYTRYKSRSSPGPPGVTSHLAISSARTSKPPFRCIRRHLQQTPKLMSRVAAQDNRPC